MSDRSVQAVNALVRDHFWVFDPTTDAAITGLVNGDFTKTLTKDAATSAVAVTVAEIGNGEYTVTFTPTAAGAWSLLVQHATYNPRGWQAEFDVTSGGLDPIVETAGGDIPQSQAMREILAVATGISSGFDGSASQTPIFKAPDGTTARVTFTLDAEGNRTAVVVNP